MSAVYGAGQAVSLVSGNPFPGLRPFELNESHLFFGRDEQVEQLISKLSRSRFVAVTGPSGSGKSSLIRAGLLPALLGGFLMQSSDNWQMAVLHPGVEPITSLALALNTAGLFATENHFEPIAQAAMLEAGLRRGCRGLIEMARQGGISSNRSLLVLVDQFEEIFRFAQVAKGQDYGNDATAFVKLLLEAAGQREFPIYVVITMRSDYLGDCARFQDLAEAINRSQYLIPQLRRDEAREAIMGPIAVGGGRITEQLLSRLLNEFSMDYDPDQLPVLQHSLMRTWEKWKESADTGPVDVFHYEATGGMSHALSRHAEEVLNGLHDDLSRRIAEMLFKALTEKGPDNREVRRPKKLAHLAAVAATEETQAREVIDAFRQPGRSFLVPPAPALLNPDSLIDISHESLIRRWERLKNWVEEESESAKVYMRLAETAELHEGGKAALWQNPDLQYALQWKEQTRPNETWASRYHSGFFRAMDFLEQSRQARQEAVHQEEQAQEREITHQQELRQVAEARADAEKKLREEADRRSNMESKAAEQARRAAKQSHKFMISLALIAIIALAEALYAVRQKTLIHEKELIAEALTVAERAELAFKNDQPAALNAAIWSWQAVKTPAAGCSIADAFPIELATLKDKIDTAASMAFSREGPLVLSANGNRPAQVWNVSNGQLVATLKRPSDNVRIAGFSPDSQRVFTISFCPKNDISCLEQPVRVWDTSSGRLLATLRGPTKNAASAVNVVSALFSPDGQRILTANRDKTARVWDASSGQLLRTLQGHSEALTGAMYSPDGQRILTASWDKTARVWDASSGQLPRILQGHSEVVTSAVFSADGRRILTASWDKTARVWDASSGQLLLTLQGRSEAVTRSEALTSAVFSADGQRILTGSDTTARVWDANSGEQLVTLHGTNLISAFSPDGQQILTGDHDGAVRVWSASTGQLLAVLRGHTDRIMNAAFSPDGHFILTTSWDKTARIWTASSSELLMLFQGRAILSPDGRRILTASMDKTAQVWDASGSQRLLLTLEGHSAAVTSAVFSPDGRRILTASVDKTAQVWDASRGQRLLTLEGHSAAVTRAVFSANGQRILTASLDNTARVWNASDGHLSSILQGSSGAVRSAAFSPDGQRVLTASDDKTAWVWDASSGQVAAILKGHSDAVTSAMFSPDGQRVLTASDDKTAQVWNAITGKPLVSLQGHSGAVKSAVFSPDGQRILTASLDRTARVWNAATGEVLANLQGHSGAVRSAVFSPDGRRILTASDDLTARLWDASSGQVLVIVRGHSQAVWSAVFSPDGQWIITASTDKSARVLRLISFSEIANLLGQLKPTASADADNDCGPLHFANPGELTQINPK
ncbi:MAG TPA: hypothetical protein VG759_04275 [Candidatus Angelobacter sp.]|nr:hypothetical protein [Candidatus Angelobacter sp.]